MIFVYCTALVQCNLYLLYSTLITLFYLGQKSLRQGQGLQSNIIGRMRQSQGGVNWHQTKNTSYPMRCPQLENDRSWIGGRAPDAASDTYFGRPAFDSRLACFGQGNKPYFIQIA